MSKINIDKLKELLERYVQLDNDMILQIRRVEDIRDEFKELAKDADMAEEYIMHDKLDCIQDRLENLAMCMDDLPATFELDKLIDKYIKTH